jgi:gliding motility-associated-like protein
MIFLNPVEQAIDEIIFEAIPSTLVSDYFLNVFVEDTDVNNVVLDGAVIPAGLFNSLAGSGLSWAQISTSGGSHRIEASGGVSAYVYGYGEFESYGYPAGMNLWPLQDPFYIEVDGQNSLYYEFDQVVDCNTEIAFTADTSEGRSLMWDFGDGNFASGSPVYHTYGEAGTYLLTLVSSIPGSCLQDTMRLSVDIDGIKHGLASDTALCPGNSLLLEVDPDLNITWHDGSESPSIVVNEVGIYSFFIQDGICSLQDSINVFDGVVPEANWNQASIVCPDNLLSALLSPGPWDLLWNNGATDNPLQVDSSGIYGVWMTSADQCEVYTEIEVEENCGIELHIPNAFSPNGDGLNDYFGINSSLTAQFHMQVFNRWGDLMFDSDDVDEKWDGSWKGKNQEIGTYFWIIRYSDIVFPDVEKVRQGTVTLVR